MALHIFSPRVIDRKGKNVYSENTGRVTQVSYNMSQHRITEEIIKDRGFE